MSVVIYTTIKRLCFSAKFFCILIVLLNALSLAAVQLSYLPIETLISINIASLLLASLAIIFLVGRTKNLSELLSKYRNKMRPVDEALSCDESSDEQEVQLENLLSNLVMDLQIANEQLNEQCDKTYSVQRKSNLFASAVTYSETAVAIVDDSFSIVYSNPRLSQLTKLTKHQLKGLKIHKLFDDAMIWVLDTAYEQLRDGQRWKGNLLIKNPVQDDLWVSQTISPIKEKIQGNKYYVSASHDISFIKRNEQQMEKLAYRDPLTGLYNRTFFKKQLNKSLEMSKRGRYAFALFYFDLDQFKRVNDNLGHEAGDELLISISNRLTKRLRGEDTLSRLGGDEFAVIVSGVSEAEAASKIALSLQEAIREPVKLTSAEVFVSASIGISMVPRDSMDAATLLRNADLAMYKAKEAGRNCYSFFNPAMGEAAQETIHLETQLRDALRHNEFSLNYQPQIDLKTGEIFGFEALIRWYHPERGLIPPNIFIPVAEQSGLIVAIGEWVLDEACQFIRRISDICDKQYIIAVNLSARQFRDENITQSIKNACISARINPQFLDIEVTESMLMGNVEESIKYMNEIRALGVQLSIDDFGTGYSSLNYLKRFPVNTLKVDRAFVQDIPEDSDDMAISSAIIAMAHKLNMKVIAEGVETKEHVNFLIENECEIGQGYLFSKPLSEPEIIDYIKEYNRH